MKTWVRARFTVAVDDYRPVTFPPPGPYWCTGQSSDGDEFVLVAYLNNREQLKEYWPEAENEDVEDVDSIVFTSRFPQPKWWQQ